MAPFHSGFAAATVVSEALVNRCLNTYVANYLDTRHAEIRRSLRVTINGAPLTFLLSADASILSVQATLRKNAQSQVALRFRFHALAELTVPVGATQAESYKPEIVIDADVAATFVALVAGDQFQLGLNLQSSLVSSLQATIGQGSLPPAYATQLKQWLESPDIRGVLDRFLHSIAPSMLRATTTTVPAFFDFTMDRPALPGGQWFSVRIAVGRLVWFPLDGCIIVAVDVPGYTSGSVMNLFGYIHPPNGPDLISDANLDFVEAFLNREVFPVMRHQFVANGVRLNKVNWMAFKRVPVRSGAASGFEVQLDITYYTNSFWHFVVADSTAVDATVTVQGYPYLSGSRLHLNITRTEVDLPWWVDLVLTFLSFAAVPVSFLVPFIFKDVMHNVLADVKNGLNRQATSNGPDLRRDVPLPETNGPPYRFEPRYFAFNADPGERRAILAFTVGPAPAAQVRLLAKIADAGTVTVPDAEENASVRLEWELPMFIFARALVPAGVVQPNDPTLRVRWETFLNGQVVAMYCRDQRYREPGSLELRLFTANFTRPKRTDQELKIRCRIYRHIAGTTAEDLLNKSVTTFSVDPRPDNVKPFVQWAHNVRYWNGYKMIARGRMSRIHRAPGKGGCRFSNQYLLPHMRARGKSCRVRRFTGLPFLIEDIEQHRDLVCPYCFFGGPDEHPNAPFVSHLDITGTVGKVFKV